ncbi:LOW QUALITY PROTEIN: hypothetical protein PHPALM_31853 [Phytophthora palmivora]|uniref:Uncharacterized protein n=1 Tax=Phytophthora palmivora TaxID=4796 RepID=A0A2P4X1J3_9STRA|nr:LOW QUALITY PROTEIN: hypothetical protein PHPALM_31853 [Phytophthora palmivora]
MTTPGSTRGGRRGRGRGAPTRQSNRLQGLPPEEQPDLDAIQKAAREKRKAAREKKAAESVNVAEPAIEDQPAAEPEAPETPAISGEQGSEEGPSDVEASGDEVTTAREGSDEVSEEGADMVESPEVVDLRSESTISGQSVEEVNPEPGLSEDRVPQSPKSEGAPMSDDTLIKSEDSLKTPSDESGRADSLDGERALKYGVLRRWKDVDAGRVVPPSVEYVWPTTKPSVAVFQKAAAATGDYIKWRCSSVFPEDMWISEFHARRHGFGRIQDLSYVEIPMSTLTAPECVAVLQTMLYEAGFEFQNLLPTWSQTQASNGSSSDEPPPVQALAAETAAPTSPVNTYESRSDSTRPESGTPMSEDRNSSRTRMTDVPVPSVIGTSDDQSSGVQTSRGSSTDSSLMSVSRGAASHMPLSAGGLALIAQGDDVGGMVYGEGMGNQVIRALLPVKPEPEDINMLEEKAEVSDVKSEKQAFVHEPSQGFRQPTPEIPSSSVSSRSATHRSHRQSVKSEDLLKTPSRRLSSIASSHTKSEVRSSQRSGPAQIELNRSGPAQIELNVMRQQREWQSRMEQAQMEFLARERLDSMERDRRREQREIQMLTDRLVESENARLEAERRADDAEERRSLVSESKLRSRSVAELETLKSDLWKAESQRLESEFADRWRQREAEAEVQHEARLDFPNEDLTAANEDMEAERDKEKESSQNM